MILYFIGGSMDLTKQRVASARPRTRITFARREYFDFSRPDGPEDTCPEPITEIYDCCGSAVGMKDTYVYSFVGTINHPR